MINLYFKATFLSDLERNYFYLTEYSDFVIDIREQFPLLPLEETIVIVDELGLKHPTDLKTQEPVVMTTDFLLTVDKGEGLVELKSFNQFFFIKIIFKQN